MLKKYTLFIAYIFLFLSYGLIAADSINLLFAIIDLVTAKHLYPRWSILFMCIYIAVAIAIAIKKIASRQISRLKGIH